MEGLVLTNYRNAQRTQHLNVRESNCFFGIIKRKSGNSVIEKGGICPLFLRGYQKRDYLTLPFMHNVEKWSNIL